jgi:hypothetical protein
MKVKPDINSVEVHPQLNNNGHAVDGALGGYCVMHYHIETYNNYHYIITHTNTQ